MTWGSGFWTMRRTACGPPIFGRIVTSPACAPGWARRSDEKYADERLRKECSRHHTIERVRSRQCQCIARGDISQKPQFSEYLEPMKYVS
eukprot:scaffold91979_cov31-Tisochrysis_lutea.AAC.6